MSHLDDGLLHAWLDGEVDAAEDERVQRHLEDCAECAERLGLAARDRAAASELLGELGGGPRLLAAGSGLADPIPAARVHPEPDDVADPRSPARGPGWPRTVAWAASIVLAVALGWYARSPQPLSGPAAPADAARPGPAPEDADIAAQPAEIDPTTGIADAVAGEAPRAAPAPRQARFREAGLAESAPAAFAVTASPTPSIWLGRDPLLPSGARVTAIELLPAQQVAGSVGSAPVVAFDVVLADGRMARLFEQRVAESDRVGGVAEAESSAAERRAQAATDRASAIIDGVLVMIEGPGARGLLERIRQDR